MPRRKPVARSWCAERWLAALDDGWEGRLSRGRTYAQGGRVRDLSIEPGLITARVQGTRPAPYRVELRLPIFDDTLWRQVVPALAARAANAAALLNGELPGEAEAAFAALGRSLFPLPEERVAASCSCLDWVKPCKHAAAVMYVVAAEMDHDPFVVFALRGRTRDELLASLRAERSRGSIPKSSEVAGGSAIAELAELVKRFWSLPLSVERPSGGAGPNGVGEAESVLHRLGQPPRGLGGAELRRELATAYELLQERAREALSEEAGSGCGRRHKDRAEDGAAEG